MSSSCHLVATGVAGTGENTLCAGENSEVLHQLRDANLDVTVEKNQREQEEGGGRSAAAEQPDLSAQGALALQWHWGWGCTSQLRQQEPTTGE